MGTELRVAMQVAAKLRSAGRTVDLVLEDKKMKWVFKHAEDVVLRLVMVMPMNVQKVKSHQEPRFW